jgi:hypothetical protein
MTDLSEGNAFLTGWLPGVFIRTAAPIVAITTVNGLFTVVGGAGETFTGITLASGSNSFEIDRLAVSGAVPEPATWAMMIAGFGFIGGTMRVRRRTLSFA